MERKREQTRCLSATDPHCDVDAEQRCPKSTNVSEKKGTKKGPERSQHTIVSFPNNVVVQTKFRVRIDVRYVEQRAF